MKLTAQIDIKDGEIKLLFQSYPEPIVQRDGDGANLKAQISEHLLRHHCYDTFVLDDQYASHVGGSAQAHVGIGAEARRRRVKRRRL